MKCNYFQIYPELEAGNKIQHFFTYVSSSSKLELFMHVPIVAVSAVFHIQSFYFLIPN